jgi:uncharacterized repeat protein (TIGR03803 family)
MHVVAARSQSLTTLYAFKGGDDAATPGQQDLIDVGGTLYGSTNAGGVNNGGTVYALNPTTGSETVLARLVGRGNNVSGLTYLRGGLFGEIGSGLAGCGALFEVSAKKIGPENILYNFQCKPDGEGPSAGLTRSDHIVYGTTSGGGQAGYGTVFSFNPTTGQEQIIYSFAGYPNDGSYPMSYLTYAKGALYGATSSGGHNDGPIGVGTVFTINPNTGTEAVIYSFTGGADGGYPESGLVYQDGYLYGTTYSGGLGSCLGGCGTVFKINVTTGIETVLHSFAGGVDGGNNSTGLVYERGELYGTTNQGGTWGFGTLFKVDIKTARTKTLYSFTGGLDGAEPFAGLTYSNGYLYGTTAYGGAFGLGTVFQLQP